MITGTRLLTSMLRSCCLLTVILFSRADATIIYVDSRATGGNNGGSSWSNAYLDLQDAINQAYGNPATYPEIRVAQGRYTPDSGSLDPNSRFNLVSGVVMKGGYAGVGAANPDDRNIIRYESILSGDLNGDDVPCNLSTNSEDNCLMIVSGFEPGEMSIVDLTSVLDGFTITGARNGVGVYLPYVASPTIQYCTISYNAAPGGIGGAVYCEDGASPVVSHCLIEGNEAKSNGGMFLSAFADAQIDNCRFVRNKATHGGGGIAIGNKAKPIIEFTVFEANEAGGGGAISIAQATADRPPNIHDCKFINNVADSNGGAIANGNGYPFSIVNCLFTGNRTTASGSNNGGGAVCNTGATVNQFVNCAFSHNSANGRGGAIFNNSSTVANTLTLVNCSFSANSASGNGGGVCGNQTNAPVTILCTMNISNSVFWANTGSDGSTLGKQISNPTSLSAITYSSIDGCSGGCFSGVANNDTNPTFVNAAADNLRLQSSSLVIDSANNCQVSGSVTTDLDGATRRIDDSTGDSGLDCASGPVTYLDRGAYEFNRSLDCNSNGRNDNDDILCGGGNNCSGTDGSYDCNHDGIPDDCVAICLKGDVNHDTLVNGDDIRALVNRLLGASTCAYGDCESDVNSDTLVNIDDIPCFVGVLMGETSCAYTCPASFELIGSVDCNANGINDANDIADGTSQDCNHNFIPDECDIDANDPDGNELVSADVNANSIPDECEPDCNVNSIPDAWDITQMTSADVNTNGVPDECEVDCNNNTYPDDYDIAMSTSADCNANGIPDECETDCNENGVPDDCDIDPADPDGNQQVSADCNADGMPDECNLTLPPPYGSFDCNENGILDECDIASAFSEDANENGVPDECEESGLFGGESMMGGSEQFPVDQEAAWEAFYEWSFSQCWGPQCALSTSEQFQLYLDKLAELGLSMEGGAPTP